ncbi:hypothetical protein [Tenacibaculum sp. 190130A14a]|uniref:Lipoprotein n=1 Tax=Tenacibaculum polynesiense TaxID=3137857 RepID=A0ABP1F7A0_9FLAO
MYKTTILSQILYLITFIFFGCKSVDEKINFSHQKINSNIIIRSASDNKNSIIRIQFPSKLTLTNNSKICDIDFLVLEYKYANIASTKNYNIAYYTENKGKLTRVKNNKKKTISPNTSIDYIVHTRHYVDSSRATQKHFEPYVDRMLKENKDTLHIGTVTEFKQKHKDLFEMLTKNDSISIQLLDNGKFGKRITVPIEW